VGALSVLLQLRNPLRRQHAFQSIRDERAGNRVSLERQIADLPLGQSALNSL
jgi:hypothetical protein